MSIRINSGRYPLAAAILIMIGIGCGFGLGYQQGYSEPKSIEITTTFNTTPGAYEGMYRTYVRTDPESIPANCCVAVLKVKMDSNVLVQINISQNLRNQGELYWNWTLLAVLQSEMLGGNAGWYMMNYCDSTLFWNPLFDTWNTTDPSFFMYESTLNSDYSFIEPIEIILVFFGYKISDSFHGSPWVHLTYYITTSPVLPKPNW
jgi:hypothetical protein